MDIISYGIANKAGASEKKTRTQVLATGVQGRNLTVKDRLDSFDLSLEGLTRKANQLIINDAVNIMKSHARLNAIAKSSRYKMENMIFDDLLTLEGIDTKKSKNIAHDTVMGEFTSEDGNSVYQFETTDETTGTPAKQVLLQIDQESSFQISKDIVSKGKPVKGVSGSVSNPSVVTDGIKTNTALGAYAFSYGAGEIEVDLESVHTLEWINVIFYYGDGRKYKDVRYSISEDGVVWRTVFNSKTDGDFVSTIDGKKIMLNDARARYIRAYANGNTENIATHWVEIEAFGAPDAQVFNVAKGKKVTAVSGNMVNLTFATDGRLDNVTGDTGWTGTTRGAGEIEIDLEKATPIHEIRLFQYWIDSRIYHDVLVRVSTDRVNWTTVLDTKVTGEYVESIAGKSINVGGKSVRYIRCYNRGSTSNDASHWSEVMALQKMEMSSGDDTYQVSRDQGVTWQDIVPEQLLTFDSKISLPGNSLRLRASVSSSKKTKSYALTWT